MPLFMADTMVQFTILHDIPLVSYSHICKHLCNSFSQCLLNFCCCMAITSKAIGIKLQRLKFLPWRTFGLVDYKYLIDWIWKMCLQLCRVFANSVTYTKLEVHFWVVLVKTSLKAWLYLPNICTHVCDQPPLILHHIVYMALAALVYRASKLKLELNK